MSVLDVVTAAVFGVLIVLLARAAYVLGRNPRQQISEHERLAGGRLPANISLQERLRWINLSGMSPTDPRRVWTSIALAAVALVVLLWLR